MLKFRLKRIEDGFECLNDCQTESKKRTYLSHVRRVAARCTGRDSREIREPFWWSHPLGWSESSFWLTFRGNSVVWMIGETKRTDHSGQAVTPARLCDSDRTAVRQPDGWLRLWLGLGYNWGRPTLVRAMTNTEEQNSQNARLFFVASAVELVCKDERVDHEIQKMKCW